MSNAASRLGREAPDRATAFALTAIAGLLRRQRQQSHPERNVGGLLGALRVFRFLLHGERAPLARVRQENDR
jgi:hypothetical protein